MKKLWVVYPFTANILGTQDGYFIAVNRTNAFFVALRRIQAEIGWSVEALFMTDKRRAYTVSQEEIRYRFLPITTARGGGAECFGKQWSVPILTTLIRERPALVFLFISGGWWAVLFAVLCRALSIPYCPIVAGWGVSTRRSLRWYYANALRTIVHTEAHRRLFEQAGISTSNFSVMPMGVDTDLFASKPIAAYRQGDESVRLVHVGRIVATKNLLAALRAFSVVREAIPSSCLDVLGPVGDQDYWKQVNRYVDQHRLNDHVVFHGEVENERLPPLYQAADLMIHPSLSESFGFAVAESMACGTPVVALYGCGSLDEIIDHQVDGILTDEEHIADHTLRLLGQPTTLRQMGIRASGKVRTRYSHHRTYQDLEEIIEQVHRSASRK